MLFVVDSPLFGNFDNQIDKLLQNHKSNNKEQDHQTKTTKTRIEGKCSATKVKSESKHTSEPHYRRSKFCLEIHFEICLYISSKDKRRIVNPINKLRDDDRPKRTIFETRQKIKYFTPRLIINKKTVF